MDDLKQANDNNKPFSYYLIFFLQSILAIFIYGFAGAMFWGLMSEDGYVGSIGVILFGLWLYFMLASIKSAIWGNK